MFACFTVHDIINIPLMIVKMPALRANGVSQCESNMRDYELCSIIYYNKIVCNIINNEYSLYAEIIITLQIFWDID